MNSKYWLRHFQKNRLDRPEPDWETPPLPVTITSRLLARSLSHFQLGESGDGRCLLTDARYRYADDPDYCAALALFIAEEQEHARLLGRLLPRLGGAPISRHWTHGLFRVIRQALGVNFELQVLVIAELAGTGYYRLLQRHAADPVLVQLCDLVLADERHHVDFHAERFAANHAEWLPIERGAWAAQFQALFLAAVGVVWLDHGNALRSLGCTRRDFLREARRECIRFFGQLSRPHPAGAPGALPVSV